MTHTRTHTQTSTPMPIARIHVLTIHMHAQTQKETLTFYYAQAYAHSVMCSHTHAHTTHSYSGIHKAKEVGEYSVPPPFDTSSFSCYISRLPWRWALSKERVRGLVCLHISRVHMRACDCCRVCVTFSTCSFLHEQVDFTNRAQNHDHGASVSGLYDLRSERPPLSLDPLDLSLDKTSCLCIFSHSVAVCAVCGCFTVRDSTLCDCDYWMMRSISTLHAWLCPNPCGQIWKCLECFWGVLSDRPVSTFKKKKAKISSVELARPYSLERFPCDLLFIVNRARRNSLEMDHMTREPGNA